MVKIKIIKRCKGYKLGEFYDVPITTYRFLKVLKVAYKVSDVKPEEPRKKKPVKRKK